MSRGPAHAADGYARSTGKCGVCLATSGPGATNLVTGIATAYMDSIPMVAITGNVPNDLLGRDSFQEVNITGITMPITKHNFIVQNVEDLAAVVRKAFVIANSGRKGPVLIDIPKDVTAAHSEYVKLPRYRIRKLPKVDDVVFEQALEVIRRAGAHDLCRRRDYFLQCDQRANEFFQAYGYSYLLFHDGTWQCAV